MTLTSQSHRDPSGEEISDVLPWKALETEASGKKGGDSSSSPCPTVKFWGTFKKPPLHASLLPLIENAEV